MTDKHLKEEKVLGLFINDKGFGYALMTDPLTIKAKGSVCTNTNDNKKIMKQLSFLIKELEPDLLALEEPHGQSQKSSRVEDLLKRVRQFASKRKIKVVQYSRNNIRTIFSVYNAQVKYEIFEVLARNIPELEYFFFEKPVYPDVEPSVARMFDGVSLCVTHLYLSN